MKLLILSCLLAVTLACQHKGKTYKNGDEWTEQNAFMMTCKVDSNGSWRVQVKACLTPDNVQVPVNSTRSVGQFDWECKMSGNGQITMKQAVGKRADCAGNHAFGSVWNDKSFQFRCDEGGKTTFIGCIHPSGSIIPKDQTVEVDGYDISCNMNANGTVSMGATAGVNAGCKDSNGLRRTAGEEWVESEHFVKSCRSGMPVVIGCKVEALDITVPLNGKYTKDNMDYFCEGETGAYRFYTKAH